MLARLVRARPLVAATGCAAAAAAATITADRRAQSISSKPEVHLKYFNVQGAAEPIRYVMALGGLEWTETAWPVDFKKFSGPASLHKLDGPCPKFAEATASGELDVNLGRVPILVIDGKHELGQSKAIERYLARRLGLLGASEIEAAQIDGIGETVRDIKDKYQKSKTDKDTKAKFFAEEMPELMQKLEKAVVAQSPGAGPALIGKDLSYADLAVYVFVTDFFSDKAAAAASMEQCPRLLSSVKAIGEHPAIAKYRAARTTQAT